MGRTQAERLPCTWEASFLPHPGWEHPEHGAGVLWGARFLRSPEGSASGQAHSGMGMKGKGCFHCKARVTHQIMSSAYLTGQASDLSQGI